MFKIIFIDEVSAEARKFQRYMDGYAEVEHLLPPKKLDECVDEILSKDIDAVVSDFLLNEYKNDISYSVPYNGTELITEFLKIRKSFPTFVITSYDKDAIISTDDVNIVYSKGLIRSSTEETELSLRDRIITQIEHYKKKITSLKAEFLELQQKDRNNLSAIEEARLIELDSIIEGSLNNLAKFPSHLKEFSHLNQLYKLIDSTDQLLKEFKQNEP